MFPNKPAVIINVNDSANCRAGSSDLCTPTKKFRHDLFLPVKTVPEEAFISSNLFNSVFFFQKF